MTKVRIRQALARTRWQLVTFCGISAGAESVGVVDLMAIRKDHGKPLPDAKRGDAFQIILIQVKGGQSPMPTAEDGDSRGKSEPILVVYAFNSLSRGFLLP
jgi:hypothetical protein